MLKQLKKQSGQSLVEWAIMLPFLLLILISLLELAPLMNNIQKMEKACQYAARMGAIHGNTNDDIKDAVLYNTQGLIENGRLTYIAPYSNPLHEAKVAAYSETFEGKQRTYVEIVPGEIENRINGGWVMVKITYMNKIFTPLLRAVLDAGGFLQDDSFPIVRYAIYRIE